METKGSGSDDLSFERFGIEVKSADYTIQNLIGQPLADWNITKSALDTSVSENTLKGSVLLEIKDYKNITQPKQRFEDDRSKEVDVSIPSPLYHPYIPTISPPTSYPLTNISYRKTSLQESVKRTSHPTSSQPLMALKK